MRFSKRYGYSNSDSTEVILEEAPYQIRAFFVDGILDNLTYVDDDHRYDNHRKPLGIKELYRQFCYHIKVTKEEKHWDSAYCWDIMVSMINSIPWFNFYDFVEFVGMRLREDTDGIFESSRVPEYSFETYRHSVNEFFAEVNVGYRLNERGELYRQIPRALQVRLDEAQEKLENRFGAARSHYQKADRYLNYRPIDPENSIKEIVSAVESVGKTLYPTTSTLGEVIREMRRERRVPQHLISVIEKLYAYASSEPAIRHGGASESRVLIQDAEFALHTGVAIIRYLVSSIDDRE